MTVRVAAVAAAVVLLGGCGNDHAGRHAVAAYVSEVNRVELQLKGPLLELQRSNARFSTKTPAKTHASAVNARRTILRLQRVLQELHPPKEAVRLHTQLLALVAAELDLAREVESLSVFLPRISAALAPMAAIQTQLNTALKHSTGRAGQARALDAYAQALAGPVNDLRALDPPPISRPVRDGQLETLERVRSIAHALAGALRAKADARLPALERRFVLAARSNETVTAQRARIAAIVAYNNRVKALGTLATSVQKERTRLDRTLR
jgi:hypothetical protein